MKKQYKIAEITIDEDGLYWFQGLGTHPEQGGMAFTWGNYGCKSLEDLLKVMSNKMPKDDDEYKRLLAEKKSK